MGSHQARMEPGSTTETFELNNRRYLGNKHKLLGFIKEAVQNHCGDATSFFDVFAGTGVVADAFSDMDLIVNDLLYSNYICHYAFFGKGKYRKSKIAQWIKTFNAYPLKIEDNYMSQHFGNKYYSKAVASKIGRIREDIDRMKQAGVMNKKEEAILITSLIYAMDKIAHTCGHYDAYRKSTKYEEDFFMKLPLLSEGGGKHRIYNKDANELARKVKADIAYIDPPYNSRQYSDAYHLLENVATWKKPQVHGKAAKMDRSHIKSDYCTMKAPEAFNQLIERLDVKYIVVSYNNMGEKGNDRSNAKITDMEIRAILSKKGHLTVYEKTYKAFTAGKSDIDDHKEILYICENYAYRKKPEISYEYVASPLNYTGGKYKLLPQIAPKFRTDISRFYDLFAGGCNVGVNIPAKEHIFSDREPHLMSLMRTFTKVDYQRIEALLDGWILEYGFSDTMNRGYEYYGTTSSKGLGTYNKRAFLSLREDYNQMPESSCEEEQIEKDLKFFMLIIFGFNNQIRFNKEGKYNLPVGKRDFNRSMRSKLRAFCQRLETMKASYHVADFRSLDVAKLKKDDFVYVDPPYLITTATYNEQGGWNEEDEKDLLSMLDSIHKKGVSFALSNVLESKGRRNDILIDWTIKNKQAYKLHYLSYDYANSSYQTKNRSKYATIEILVTNY